MRADRFALDMLNAAEVNSEGMAAFFDHLHEMEGGRGHLAEYFSTHPASETRAEQARTNAEAQEGTRPVLSESQWQALKGICG